MGSVGCFGQIENIKRQSLIIDIVNIIDYRRNVVKISALLINMSRPLTIFVNLLCYRKLKVSIKYVHYFKSNQFLCQRFS